MKNLIIHVGYPKTATTTLQENVFYPLHISKKINFLGKAEFSGDKNFKTTYKNLQNTLLGTHIISTKQCIPISEENKKLALEDDKQRFKNIKSGEFSDHLKSDLPNLFSLEESLTPYKSLNGFDSLPERLKLMFDDGETQIKILIVLRSQISLMLSFYAQVYDRFSKINSLNTPSKTFFDEKGSLKPGEYSEIFDFHKTISLYAQTFGKDNIKILLFEDFLSDNFFFLEELSNLLSVTFDYIDKATFQKPLRKREKEKRGGSYIAKFPKKSLMSKILLQANGSGHFDYLKHVLPSTHPLGLFFRSLATHRTNLPTFSKEEIRTIFTFYLNSNLLLTQNYGVSNEKMKKYGYTHRTST